ncbi:5-formyltetrahydrofolate cyclo-ligase [Psychrobacillus sp. NEAU-3TGS]|uniref:5-formyltetrahydrofolate cyclo-ligase n=1 Tax=Psychrobacillus sp. NEAU-3TGS TaxID=2995412 RepID=UPI002498D625|nr:5-formyltetrahydrofolate cyclo-ligase [Psychrobacillus sp. NEAU-3TGS]MDI2588111.1 5-formyltetrahydrofolate cyclo-ligase [Psychrobacillus sp. NEAU-3TGS]
MLKTMLRNDMKTRLASLNQESYFTYSTEIENRLLIEESVQHASIIGITISAFPEVNTEGIIKRVWEIGKTVVVPKCNPKDRSMTFYKIDSYDQLETVYMKLLEPNPDLTVGVLSEDIDLLIVPGVVYSKTGYRIGYGGGYYDRFLTNYTGQTISLAFDFQIVDQVETEMFDIPVDKIITNKGIIPCKQNRIKEV